MSTTPATCEAFEAELSALIDAELAPEHEAVVRNHVAACAHCQRTLAALRGVDAALAGATPPEVPADLRARLDARLQRDDRPPLRAATPPRRSDAGPRRRRSWRAAGFGTALAVAASLVVYLVAAPDPTPQDVGAPARVASAVPTLEAVPEEELAMVIEFDAVEDFDVIANLEVLERLVALEEGAG